MTPVAIVGFILTGLLILLVFTTLRESYKSTEKLSKKMIKKCVACGSESGAEGEISSGIYISPPTFLNLPVGLRGFICLKCGFVTFYTDPEQVKSKLSKG